LVQFGNSPFFSCVPMSGLISFFILLRIKKGVASQHPVKYNLDEDELKRVSALSRVELEEMRKELEKAQKLIEVTNDDDEDGDDDSVIEEGDTKE